MKLLFEGKNIVAYAESTADNVALVELVEVLDGKHNTLAQTVDSARETIFGAVQPKVDGRRGRRHLRGNRTPCAVCGKKPTTVLGLRVHMRRAHDIGVEDAKKKEEGREKVKGTNRNLTQEKRAAIQADIDEGTLSAGSIMAKHGVSYAYIYGLSHPGYYDEARARSVARKLAAKKNASGVKHTADGLPDSTKANVINDYKEGRLNAREIAEKYDLNEKEDVMRIVSNAGIHDTVLARASVR